MMLRFAGYVLLSTAFVAALLLAYFLTEAGHYELILSLLLALLPIPVCVLLALWIDRFEIEPAPLLRAAFLWGAGGAVLISLAFNTWLPEAFWLLFREDVALFLGDYVTAPIVEETAKALALVVLFRFRRRDFDNVTDGVIYATMIGLGFELSENALYYLMADDVDVAVQLFFERGAAYPLAHPVFTALTGIGLGVARETRSARIRRWAPPFGLAGAMLLHFAWNYSADLGVFEATYSTIMVPAFIGILLLVRQSVLREADLIRQHLRPQVASGALSSAEVETILAQASPLHCVQLIRSQGVRAYRSLRARRRAHAQRAFDEWRAGRAH